MIKLCNERKEKLSMIIDNDNLNLKNDRVNQIKGAIDEIELFLMTLQNLQQKEIKTNYKQSINLPSDNNGIFSKVSQIFQRGKIKNTSSQFSLSDSYKKQQIKRSPTEV